MTSHDIAELRAIAARMAEVADRLYGETIGGKPITKRQAADAIEDLRIRVRRVADPE